MLMRYNKFSHSLAGLLGLTVIAWSGAASANTPKFDYKDKKKVLKDVKGTIWKAAAQAGAILTSGNSQTTAISAGATASRKSKNNKFQIDFSGALARNLLFIDSDGDGTINQTEFDNPGTQTTTELWLLKARYDRFLTASNSLYGATSVSSNEPAGKNIVGGGQVGYSRLVFKDKKHAIRAEAGYDFSYENQVGPEDGVSIHSARVFVGYEGKLTSDTGLTANVEGLFNVNTITAPPGELDALDDTRVNAVAALKTKLFKDISFSFKITAKYDKAPAFRPALPIPYTANFTPLAEKLDTLTEVSLIVNFL